MIIFNYPGHIIIGSAAGYFYSKYMHPAYLNLLSHPQFWVAVIVGSLLLDLDHQSSVINQKILLIKKKWFQQLVYVALSAFLVMHFDYSTKSIILAVLLIITAFSAHREFTHSPTGVILISGAILFCLGINDISIGLLVGIASHILADKVHDVVF